MTGPNPGALAAILGQTRCLLLDFDGPVCAVFAGYHAPVIADELRTVIAANGGTITPEIQAADGPHNVLRLTAEANEPHVTRAVADALRGAEIAAVASAQPTPGADEVLRAARDSGRRVAIVSNNAEQAVHAYLDHHALAGTVDRVIARYDHMHPRLLKPASHLVQLALTILHSPATEAVFVGDSTSDIAAGRTESVPTIGYADKPGKRNRLADAGADAIIDTMTELGNALRANQAPA